MTTTQNTTDNEPGEALGAQIMEEVRRYNDGNGCTRRQLVDNILIAISQYKSRAPLVAVAVERADINRILNEFEDAQGGSYHINKKLSLAAFLYEHLAAAVSSAPAELPHQRKDGLYEYDLGDKVVVTRSPIPAEPLQPEGGQEFKMREAGSAKGGCLDPDDPAVQRAIDGVPLCPVHKSLDERDELVLEIGNNCVACSLHERTELLNVLEPFASPDGTQDSVTVLRNAIARATSPTTPSAATMRAAEEISSTFGLKFQRDSLQRVAAIITRNLAARPNDAEREFLAASVAVWREIDRLSALPEGYKGLPSETDLRKRELAAWERYRAVLDAAATTSPESGKKVNDPLSD